MTAKPRVYEIALHEAAHVVVGVTLGLRLLRASLSPKSRPNWEGYAWFPDARGVRQALVLAAGIAWDVSTGDLNNVGDQGELKKLNYSMNDVLALTQAAGAMLAARKTIHKRVARALLERDLTHVDIEAIARGEPLE